jgi:hypothetical protein
MAISYGKPDNREMHFKRDHLGFSVKTFKIEKENTSAEGGVTIHFVYLCTKLPDADNKSVAHYENVIREIKV